MRRKKILITGGAGYVGAVLTPQLLEQDYQVIVFDLMIYGGEVLPDHDNLTLVKGDIRDQKVLKTALVDVDVVIHLACISNDPSFELNPELGKSINFDAFEPLVQACKSAGVERFIYASSSSVYGIKEVSDVHEDMALEPLTDYSIFKADCEAILARYQSNSFTTVTVRPATVCGYSPRQRLDVVVNILTNLAYHKREITVYGGNQLRPNIHIKDMADLYTILIEAPRTIVSGKIYNAGYENHTVLEIAETVRNVIGKDVKLIITETDDNRSYHVSSKKIQEELKFEAKYGIVDAVRDLKNAFENGLLSQPLDNELYSNIKRMQSIKLQ